MGAFYRHQYYAGPIFHVSTSGADSNDGSEENPFRTIQYAIDRASPGDTVNVSAGTYNEKVTISHSVFLTSESGPDSTHIENYGEVIVITQNSNNPYINGFTSGSCP